MTNTGLPDPGVGRNPPRYKKFSVILVGAIVAVAFSTYCPKAVAILGSNFKNFCYYPGCTE
jgi:hypothetical protein